jgi:tripartite motif-containing protein 13
MEYDLRCSVCWELFEDPAILDCSHTFCAKCLVPVSKRFKRSIKATCPLCKEITTATQAKGYRRNRLVVKVIAAYKAEFL